MRSLVRVRDIPRSGMLPSCFGDGWELVRSSFGCLLSSPDHQPKHEAWMVGADSERTSRRIPRRSIKALFFQISNRIVPVAEGSWRHDLSRTRSFFKYSEINLTSIRLNQKECVVSFPDFSAIFRMFSSLLVLPGTCGIQSFSYSGVRAAGNDYSLSNFDFPGGMLIRNVTLNLLNRPKMKIGLKKHSTFQVFL